MAYPVPTKGFLQLSPEAASCLYPSGAPTPMHQVTSQPESSMMHVCIDHV